MGSPLPFRTLRPALLAAFGRPMHRVALDAGSTCPNRDGTKGLGGCTYCDVEGSGTGALRSGLELSKQLEAGLARVARRDRDAGAIAYLQSYSNTYVEASRLEEVLGALEPYLDPGRETPVLCVSLATRPDTLPDAAISRLAQLARRVPVWVELGLESASDQVLTQINRLHTLVEFEDAVERCRAARLEVIGHAILGLPGDGREGARRTAAALACEGVGGVKVHQLMVLRRTQMAAHWRAGQLEVLSAEEYVSWLADFVERLRPDQVLHRITGDSPPEALLAPRWEIHKNAIREGLAQELKRRGTRQGALFECVATPGRGSAL